MAGNPPEGGLGDDFLEQILAVPPSYNTGSSSGAGLAADSAGGGGYGGDVGSMMLQLGSSGTGSSSSASGGYRVGVGSVGMSMGLPLGLNLEQGFMGHDRFRDEVEPNNNHNNNLNTSNFMMRQQQHDRDSVPSHMSSLFPAFRHLQNHSLRPTPPPPPPPPAPQPHQVQQFHSQPPPGPAPPVHHPPAIRPRVRARRGQATDPHSIAERLRRERIAERMKALQELVPSCNKTDRAAMLDEIVDYVKFLRLQVKVLSMSRLGGAGAVAQLVADVPLSAVEGEGIENDQQVWEKWSNDGTEQQVAKLMEEDVGAAMQYLQSKALCIVPISLAPAIFRTHQPDATTMVKPESHNSS